jgi:hypothetical protein
MSLETLEDRTYGKCALPLDMCDVNFLEGACFGIAAVGSLGEPTAFRLETFSLR